MDPHPHPPMMAQLPLPLDVPAAIRSPQPLAEVIIRPRALWHGLPRDLQEQTRRTLIQICQELLDDGA